MNLLWPKPMIKIILVKFICIKSMNLFPNACPREVRTCRQNVLLHLHLSYSDRRNTCARETYTFLDCSNAQ